jgi:hypothetical protein
VIPRAISSGKKFIPRLSLIWRVFIIYTLFLLKNYTFLLNTKTLSKPDLADFYKIGKLYTFYKKTFLFDRPLKTLKKNT